MKSTQCHYFVAHANMAFRTFGELMLYMLSKCIPSHRMQMQTSRISLYMCFLMSAKYYIFGPLNSHLLKLLALLFFNVFLLVFVFWYFANH
jgi:hypothetical protein